MDELLTKAQDTADKFRGLASGIASPGVPVTQLMTRNDLTPVADELIRWVKNSVRELEAEKLAHADSRASRLFLETALKIYNSVTEGMVFKGKEQEHELAMRRTNDIINAGVNAWERMQHGTEVTSDQ